jgi:hypothetical protein
MRKMVERKKFGVSLHEVFFHGAGSDRNRCSSGAYNSLWEQLLRIFRVVENAAIFKIEQPRGGKYRRP